MGAQEHQTIVSKMIIKNPPAFPVCYQHTYNDPATECTSEHPGMTLRDYFAAAALPALVAKFTSADTEIVARLAYQLADRMVVERGN